MKLHEFSIKHPITILMCTLVVLLLGAVSVLKQSVALMPNIDVPVAVVITTYDGAGSEEMENMVTKKIESVMATVENVKKITSESWEGSSMVLVEFNNGTDLNFASLQMREKIDEVKSDLPKAAKAPSVFKFDPNTMPVAYLGITSKNGALDEVSLKTLVKEKIKPRLERLAGVASVKVTGGKNRVIKVEADPQQTAAYGVSLNTIISTLTSENLTQPGGTVAYGEKDLLVRSMGEVKSIPQLEKMPIPLPSGGTVYLRELALVSDSFTKVQTYSRMNGEASIGVSVQKQSKGNTLKVVNAVKKELGMIRREYPDLETRIAFDQGKYIEDSIANVTHNAVSGGILAILVLVLFLNNFRTALFIGTSIPISIIATFIMMYFTGINLNTISLGGLALGVGMLVDNAVVVLENIHRHRHEGYSLLDAAKLGAGEVGGAVLASTLTTVVVFLPIVFTGGMTAQIFKELALTVTFSLLASFIVAFTLIPLLCSRYLKIDEEIRHLWGGRFITAALHWWSKLLEKVLGVYHPALKWVLCHRKITVIIAVGVFIFSLCLLPLIGIEFYPKSDQGQFSVMIELPQGSALGRTDLITRKVEELIFKIPELKEVFVNVGSSVSAEEDSTGESHIANINVTLKPLKERNRKTAAIVDELRQRVKLIPGADIKVTETTSDFDGGSSAPVVIKIHGDDIRVIENLSKKVAAIIIEVDGIRDVKSSIAERRPEARIIVDRDKAADYGLGISEVASFIQNSIQGGKTSKYKIGGEEYDIMVEYPEAARQNYEQLKDQYIISNTGLQVPLSAIAEVQLGQGPVKITRERQQRYVTVSAQIFGRSVGKITNDISQKLSRLKLPDGYTIDYGGEEEEIQESFSSLGLALVLAVILVYAVMACQYESLLQPFIIMFSLPLAYSGAIFGLVLTRRSLGVTALIGVIMLAGIVVNNAIVLVDYVNTLKKGGMNTRTAILKAGPTRLKPILMTSLTTILGLVPLALGIGEGGESQAPMATVVIGGLLTSAFLTLVIVPVIYSLFDDWHEKRALKKTDRNIPVGQMNF
jgi:HAE1 family hydrophobic/amphiphilic exporter-1